MCLYSMLEKNIIIRKAVSEDAMGITTVLYKTWLATYPNPGLGITTEDIEESYKGVFTPEKLAKQAENIVKTPVNQMRLVALCDNVIVGVSTAVIHDDNNQLKTIYVLPEFQGRGIGGALWNEIKKFLDPTKDTIVELATYNQNAIAFYSSKGFKDTGKRMTDPRWKMMSGATIPEMEMKLVKATPPSSPHAHSQAPNQILP